MADSGVSDVALDDALDSDDLKASLIAAIVDPEVDSASVCLALVQCRPLWMQRWSQRLSCPEGWHQAW